MPLHYPNQLVVYSTDVLGPAINYSWVYANGMVPVITLLLLYFEDHKWAFRTSAIFFLANLLLSLLLLLFGFNGYSISFAIGSSIPFLYAISRLLTYIKDIDYYTSCQSNVPIQQRMLFTKLANKLNRK